MSRTRLSGRAIRIETIDARGATQCVVKHEIRASGPVLSAGHITFSINGLGRVYFRRMTTFLALELHLKCLRILYILVQVIALLTEIHVVEWRMSLCNGDTTFYKDSIFLFVL